MPLRPSWLASALPALDGAIKSVDSLVKALTNSPIAKTISGIVLFAWLDHGNFNKTESI